MVHERSVLTAAISLRLSVAAASLFVLGPILAQSRLVEPMVALGASAAGVVLGAGAAPLVSVSLWLTRDRYRSRRWARTSMVLVLPIVVLGGSFAFRALRVPRINDVTTDTVDPPVLPVLPKYAAAGGYAGERFATKQREAYPDVSTHAYSRDAETVFATAQDVAARLGWRIEAIDRERRLFRATDRTAVFRFVDDVAVRIRTSDAGCVVDVRSRSRVGVSDLGVNAGRIRRFLSALDRALAG